MVCNYDKENAVPGLCKEEEAFLGPGADDREADDFEGPEDRNLKTDRAGRREVSSDRLEDCGWDELGEEEEEEKPKKSKARKGRPPKPAQVLEDIEPQGPVTIPEGSPHKATDEDEDNPGPIPPDGGGYSWWNRKVRSVIRQGGDREALEQVISRAPHVFQAALRNKYFLN